MKFIDNKIIKRTEYLKDKYQQKLNSLKDKHREELQDIDCKNDSLYREIKTYKTEINKLTIECNSEVNENRRLRSTIKHEYADADRAFKLREDSFKDEKERYKVVMENKLDDLAELKSKLDDERKQIDELVKYKSNEKIVEIQKQLLTDSTTLMNTLTAQLAGREHPKLIALPKGK